MLDYLKKFKPNSTKTGPETKSPVLTHEDEKFLESALRDENVENVILPGTSGTTTPIAEETAETMGEGQKPGEDKKEDETDGKTEAQREEAKKEEEKKEGEWMARFQGLTRSISSAAQRRKTQLAEAKAQMEEKKKEKEKEKEKIKAQKEKEKEEAQSKKKEKEKPFEREDELTEVLEQLNLAAEDGRAFSMSEETKALLNRFTQILKDIQKGVPTAYDDLVSLLDNSSSTLERTYSNLPGFLQKLIKTLPTKITPEVLQTAAAASPALATEGSIIGVRELIKKPGLLMGMLKGVVNALKTRFPALLGVNAVLSMALFVVLLVLWYVHKRGREVRLEQEAKQRAKAETEVTTADVEVVGGEAQTTNDPHGADTPKS